MGKWIALIWLLAWGAMAYGSEKCKEIPPVDDFACNLKSTLLLCQLQSKLAVAKRSGFDSVYQCAAEAKGIAKKLYPAAKAAVEAKPDGVHALKDLYAFWLTSLEMLTPSTGDSRRSFERKQEERFNGVSERANLLMIENQ